MYVLKILSISMLAINPNKAVAIPNTVCFCIPPVALASR